MVWRVTRHDGRPIAGMEAPELSNFANRVINMERRDSSFVAELKPVMNFNDAFEKEHGVPFLTSRIKKIFEDVVSSEFLTDNCPQTYQCKIQVEMFILQYPNLLNVMKALDGERAASWVLYIPRLENGTLFLSRAEEKHFWFVPRAIKSKNPVEPKLFHTSLSYQCRRGLLCVSHGLYQ